VQEILTRSVDRHLAVSLSELLTDFVHLVFGFESEQMKAENYRKRIVFRLGERIIFVGYEGQNQSRMQVRGHLAERKEGAPSSRAITESAQMTYLPTLWTLEFAKFRFA